MQPPPHTKTHQQPGHPAGQTDHCCGKPDTQGHGPGIIVVYPNRSRHARPPAASAPSWPQAVHQEAPHPCAHPPSAATASPDLGNTRICIWSSKGKDHLGTPIGSGACRRVGAQSWRDRSIGQIVSTAESAHHRLAQALESRGGSSSPCWPSTKGVHVDSTRRTALVAGLFYLIPSLPRSPPCSSLAPVLNNPDYIVSPGADIDGPVAQILRWRWGATPGDIRGGRHA